MDIDMHNSQPPLAFDPRDVVAVREFRATQVPAFLSTSDHLHHLLTTPANRHSPAEIEAALHRRQELVTRIARDDVRQTYLIGEPALHELDGPQLARILQRCVRRNVVVRVLPEHPQPYTNLAALTMFSFADRPDWAFPQLPTASAFVQQPAEVAMYSNIFDNLATHALSEIDSRAYVQTKLGEVSTATHRDPDELLRGAS
ncbi:hypothetical protein GCM10029964_089910 [Kibdelosporangium lantanae]